MRHASDPLVPLLLALALAAPVAAQFTPDQPRGEIRVYGADSGVRPNGEDRVRVVYREVVHVDGAAWLRLHLGQDTTLEAGTVLRVSALDDLDVQTLDAADLEAWSRTTAYFNGSSLLVELVAAPRTAGNRLVIESVSLEERRAAPPGLCGICGDDDRVPSDEEWVGRLMPSGCTASVWNEESCLVSAGHCVGGQMVIQFRVPPSNPDCTLNHPPVAEQFPVTDVRFTNNGVGDDWSAMTTGPNNLGETAFGRYGEMRPIALSPPVAGQPVTVWGYGGDIECTRSQTQQISLGEVTSVPPTHFRFDADIAGGNSGSSVIRNGQIIGIVTHCPCPNYATRYDHPDFVAARAELCGKALRNDDCRDAFPAGDGESWFTTEATSEEGPELPPVCDEGNGLLFRRDVWFRYVASCDGTATASVCAADFDTRLAVYEDGDCPGPFLACNDDACGDGGVRSSVSFPVEAGGAYLVRIGARFAVGTGTLHLACVEGTACPADLDGSGAVDFGDVLEILAAWGPCGEPCPEDLDESGAVDFGDVLVVLGEWGSCE